VVSFPHSIVGLSFCEVAMDNGHVATRRTFLGHVGATLGILCLGSLTPEMLAQAHHHAVTAAAESTQTFRFFNPAQAREVDAIAAQLIPADETPGAREANVVHFIDYVINEFEPQNKDLYVQGLAILQEQVAKTSPSVTMFSALTPEKQIEVLKAIEKTTFFALVRTHTITGFLCDPELGGNRNQVGWKLVGFEDKFYYEPPFGYYDAQEKKL
jgi:gluconate 2-dehydrogenase gamma chain